ncbi:MAG: TIGR02147 family protein [Myxococcota bacterium]
MAPAIDYRTFLRERLPFGEQRRLAKHLGRSPGWLSMVLNSEKRSLSPEVAVDVAEGIGLSERERDYFVALVELEEGNSDSSRANARAMLRAHALLDAPEDRSVEALALFSEGWYVAAILELARCDDFVASPRWIASVLNPSIETTQASRALALLIRHGLLDADGRALPDADLMAIATPLDMPATLTSVGRQLHREAMTLAGDAASRFYPSERHLGAGFVALSEERFDEIRSLFRKMFLQAVAQTTVDDGSPNRVYQFALALHPVSHYSDDHMAEPIGASP